MIKFFSKKKFLVDYLENFVDIHNHILPGIDDGSASPEESVEIIKGYAEFGLTRFIATPHIMSNYYPNTPDTIGSALAALNNELLLQGMKHITVEASAEHMVDANFEMLLDREEVMPMKKEYLLVEMSFLQPPINFDDAIVKTASKRYYPILAHPERYKFLQQRMGKYEAYKKQGISFQMNLLSLGDYYGKEVTKTAIRLLDEGLVDYVASDVHNLSQLEALKETTVNENTIKLLLPVIHRTITTFY